MSEPQVKKKHIVVIDDDTVLLKMLSELLSARGYAVTTENEPMLAVARLWKADLIILDLMLSPTDACEGRDVMAHLWENISFETPIIIYSGHSNVPEVRDEVETAIARYGKGRKIYKFIEKGSSVLPLLKAVDDYFTA
jgi:CheY-like chemotaxis protein